MNTLNITAESLREKEKNYLNAKVDFEKDRNKVITDIKEKKNNLEWILEDGEYKCLLKLEVDWYFRCMIENEYNEYVDKNDVDLEELREAFLNDVTMSVLEDKAEEISKTLGNKENNEYYRKFFETNRGIELAIDQLGIKEIEFEGLQTNLFLKDIRPFIIFVLHTSKKTSKNLLERFNGFRLVNAKYADMGEDRVYYEYNKNSKQFFNLLQNSKGIDKALSLKFFDTYTDYINIHYLAKEIYAEEKGERDKKLIDFLKGLIKFKVKSPLVINLLINSSNNTEFLKRSDVLETYASLFKECKNSLKSFLNKKGDKKSTNETDISYKLKMYKEVYDSFGQNEFYMDLVDDLIDEINDSIEENEQNLCVDPYDLEVFKERVFGIKGSYSNTYFGEAYRIVYNSKYSK
ncbi:hypothetical protein M3603_11090 [Rummeliibacillus stabekisii]|uniref:hypothetical protein n=1 Tax=Rummeliibacillus stabekisii TaxID=241244 RepID=UPI0020404790|nr:hypothetical protein [Rummeliibacillus stabekisii]MCM3317191.1 hypothetical protein [Rummeliibacillus stabekisii]